MRSIVFQPTFLLICALLHAPASAQLAGPEAPQARQAAQTESATPLGAPATESRRLAREPSTSGLGLGRTIGAVGVVAGLAFAGWVVVRAVARAHGGFAATLGPAGRAPSGVLEVLGRYPVGRLQTLVLLRIDRRVLLLSQSGAGRLGAGSTFTTLCEIADPEDVASILVKARDDDSRAASDRFSDLLGGYARDHHPFADHPGTIPVVDLTKRDRTAHVPAIVASVQKRLRGARAGGAG